MNTTLKEQQETECHMQEKGKMRIKEKRGKIEKGRKSKREREKHTK